MMGGLFQRWLPAISIAAVVLAAGAGYWFGRSGSSGGGDGGAEGRAAATTPTTYTCSMHPQIRLPKPGKCPICQMDLTPVEMGGDPGPRALSMSEAAMALADIEVARVERRPARTRVRMVGKVAFDETRVKTISAWVSGRLDRLYVDYTGVPVAKGEHLVDLYSPEMYAAQQQLLEAIRTAARLGEGGSEFVRSSTRATVEAVREKFRLWGLSESQIRDIEQQEGPRDHILITAPVSGVVVEKLQTEGDYVQTGTPVYRIADLSRLWVMLDAYESDLEWLRYGQDVRFTTESFPGRVFTGRVDYIDWAVRERSRSTMVRVNVDNSDGRLKPGMFVRAEVLSEMDAHGHVRAPDLSDKWICPMHPDVIRDAAGQCDVCGMDLVPGTKVVGPHEVVDVEPLLVPATAPIQTGRRAVVYVKLPDRAEPTFEGREVVLGPRAGDDYVVLSGLAEGEEVVVRGNFKIDGALQIQAKPSAMYPEGGGGGMHHHHGGDEAKSTETAGADESEEGSPASQPANEPGGSGAAGMAMQTFPSSADLQDGVTKIWAAYEGLHAGLAADDLGAARRAGARLVAAVDASDAAGLTPEARARWQELARKVRNEATLVDTAQDLADARDALHPLTLALRAVEHTFGHTDGKPLVEIFCPMARAGRGAPWFQRSEEVANPYFGADMLRCGEVKDRRESQPSLRAQGVSPEFQRALGRLATGCAGVQSLLAADGAPAEVEKVARSIIAELPRIAESAPSGPDGAAWRELRADMARSLEAMAAAEDIAGQRNTFYSLTVAEIAALDRFGFRSAGPFTEMFCPMAMDGKGAPWLQLGESLRNPYYGSMMLECGEQRRKLLSEREGAEGEGNR